MKNKIFNPGVFWEAFSQLKIVGLIATAIYAVSGILTPVGMLVSRLSDPYRDIFQAEPKELSSYYFLILFGLVYVFIPIMMMVIFFWMNKRNSCDFYHALPIKRGTMYISTIFAVLLWVVIIVASACIFTLVIVGVSPHLTIDMTEFFKILGHILAGCIQMVGIFAIGITVTGNGFTNVIASLMLLAVPRGILSIITSIVEEFMPFIEVDMANALINPIYNICFSDLIVFGFMEYDQTTNFIAPIIYSTVLGIIYTAIAGLLFKKRKSETASQPSTYGVIQSICRMIPAYLFSLAGIYSVLYTNIWDVEYNIDYYFSALVFFIISILAYFIYELITTRRWKSVGKSAKQLPVFAGIVIVSGLLIWAIPTAAMNRKVEADKMQYIEVGYVDRIGYFSLDEKIVIKAPEAFGIIEEAYEEQLDSFKNSLDYQKSDMVEVGINQGGTTFYRKIYLDSSDMDILMQHYVEAIKDEKVKINLPKYSNNLYIYLSVYDYLDEQQIKRLYETLALELKNVDYADVISANYDETLTYIKIESYDYNQSYNISVPISDATPKTESLLISMMRQNGEENNNNTYFEKLLDEFRELEEYESLYIDWDITVVSRNNIEHYGICGEFMGNTEAMEKLLDTMELFTQNSSDDNIIFISGNIERLVNEGYVDSEWINVCYKADDELAAKLKKVLEPHIYSEKY
ncbi:MAG: hypothetical protein ACI4EN_04065 [Butyrivibrio sp.]